MERVGRSAMRDRPFQTRNKGAKMQFLTISRRRETAGPAHGELVRAEVQRAKELYSEGSLRQLWHRGDGPGACLMWEAESESQVWEFLKSLPFFQSGMIEVSVIPLRPWFGFCPEMPM